MIVLLLLLLAPLWTAGLAQVQKKLDTRVEVLNKDQVWDFSCGKLPLYYRTFYLDEGRDALYVGAMDKVFKLNLSNISQTKCESDQLTFDSDKNSVDACVSRGKSEHFECKNHIRIIQPIGDGSRLFVCGTGAHAPKTHVINNDLTHLDRGVHMPGVGSGVGYCPYDPNDNSTAVWVESGNPGDLPGLYSGTNAEFAGSDSLIFRSALHTRSNSGHNGAGFKFMRTIKYDSKWLDRPNFVGSYDIGEHVLFFFREMAVEYINCGKNVFSRIARVCKKDMGGKRVLPQNWVTYLKARLNCSIPGDFPFYFNEIQDVYKVPGDDNKFYATFTTSTTGLTGSAICSFTLSDIQSVFRGRFKEQANSSAAWLPVQTKDVPDPRPGECVNDTKTLPDEVLNFIRSHPLMDEAVAHRDNKPVFFKTDVLFTHLVVDIVNCSDLEKTDVQECTVYFVATNTGHVYKIVQWYDESMAGPIPHSALLDIFEVAPNQPIRAMEISRTHRSLYVAYDSGIKQIKLEMCAHRLDSCIRCVRDPYCGWDRDSKTCKPYQPGKLIQDVSSSQSSICDSSVRKIKKSVTWGQTLHLTCFVKLPASLSAQQLTWCHRNTRPGVSNCPIKYRPDKFVSTTEGGLVIIAVDENDDGNYECKIGNTLLCNYNIVVDPKRCTAPSQKEDYRKVYADWCNEFRKYKSAMEKWQLRQEQCSSRSNSTLTIGSDSNSLNNEINKFN
uniref:Semaphorin-2A n=2 Tax=Cacopsylla melanoneura TaxID=428564 RepID=A0A8D8XHJ2_9HEMI